jgi:3-phenylpropionate/trans-cinnamate dioxygenase ferredoxin component
VPEQEREDGWRPIPVALPERGGTERFELDGVGLLLCNADGAPYVIEDRCPHGGISLHGGRISGTTLECPMHGGKLDLRDGSPVSPPIRRPCRAYAVHTSGAVLEIAPERSP